MPLTGPSWTGGLVNSHRRWGNGAEGDRTLDLRIANATRPSFDFALHKIETPNCLNSLPSTTRVGRPLQSSGTVEHRKAQLNSAKVPLTLGSDFSRNERKSTRGPSDGSVQYTGASRRPVTTSGIDPRIRLPWRLTAPWPAPASVSATITPKVLIVAATPQRGLHTAAAVHPRFTATHPLLLSVRPQSFAS